jgi:peptidoglycan-N-acetylglucosamine deacetylase
MKIMINFIAKILLIGAFFGYCINIFAQETTANTANTVKTLFPYPFLTKCLSTQGIITNEKIIALTFDDGPNGKYTEEVLTILDKYKIKATFFVIGKNIAPNRDGLTKNSTNEHIVSQNRAELLKAYSAGHVIGTHSYTHPMMDKISEAAYKEELNLSADAIHEVIGKYPVLFRPPYGRCTIPYSEITKNMGYSIITWSDVADDYNIHLTTSMKIANDITQLAKPGGIILLHDGGGNRTKTVNALPKIIESLTKEGYRFITIPEMIGIEAYRDKK